MILPNLLEIIEGRAAFVQTKGPVRLVRMISSHRSIGIWTVGRRKFIPALQMRMSGGPTTAFDSERNLLIWDSSATSAPDPKVRTLNRVSISDAVSSADVLLRPLIRMFAPAAASVSAMCLPSPWDPPVIQAVLPLSEKSCSIMGEVVLRKSGKSSVSGVELRRIVCCLG